MHDLWIAGLIALALIWLVGLRLLPVTIWRQFADDRLFHFYRTSANARNWPGLIIMREGSLTGAVWAQEFYEARLKWTFLPFSLALIAVGRLVPRLAYFERAMELMGHEIEVWAEGALTGGQTTWIRSREAVAMRGYRAFRGWDVTRIEHEMMKRSVKAQRFVSRHHQRIEAMHQKGKAR